MARKVGQGEEEEVARARLQEEKRYQPTVERRRCRSYRFCWEPWNAISMGSLAVSDLGFTWSLELQLIPK
ncbi:hypothetical protein STEG23_030859, partial [Scotinomys teguina]